MLCLLYGEGKRASGKRRAFRTGASGWQPCRNGGLAGGNRSTFAIIVPPPVTIKFNTGDDRTWENSSIGRADFCRAEAVSDFRDDELIVGMNQPILARNADKE